MTFFWKLRHPLALLLFAFSVYAALFIYQGSYDVGGKRYFLLFDDAMVSMRYGRNLVEGHGLVWNPHGERVEGFTNPAWTLMMAATHLVPVPASKTSLLVLIIAALILLANIAVIFRIVSIFSDGLFAPFVAGFFTAFCFSLNHWSFLGMEVSALTLLTSAAVLLGCRVLSSGVPSWLVYVVLSFGTLIRIDFVVPATVIVGFLAVADRPNRRSHLLRGFGLLTSVLLLQTVLRLWYYGDILPNTYYLKMTGFDDFERISHGLGISVRHLTRLSPVVVLLIAGFLLAQRNTVLLLPAAVFFGQLLYNAYVGGDAWEWWGETNRYIVIAMPMIFVLLSLSAKWVADSIRSRLNVTPFRQRWLVMPVVVTGLAAAFLIVNRRGDWDLMRELVFTKKPVHVYQHDQALRTALALDSIATKNAKIAVIWAGVVPYLIEREAVDMLGKNDRTIAHLPMRASNHPGFFNRFVPGHMKYDYAHSIGQLKPDIVVELWEDPEQGLAQMKDSYWKVSIGSQHFFVRKDSPNIARTGLQCAVCKSDPWAPGHDHLETQKGM